MKKLFLILVLAIPIGVLAFTVPAQAITLTLELDTPFGTKPSPDGVAPWLRATFDDDDSFGSVTLTLEARLEVEDNFIKEVYFNFYTDSFDVNKLHFGTPTTNADVTAPAISFGVDSFKADGDGLYDILLAFEQNDKKKEDLYRFDDFDTLVFTITSSEAITANSFDFYSTYDGGEGVWKAVAKVQGLLDVPEGEDDSTWIGPSDGFKPVPEPATVLLLGTGLIGLAAVGRRKKFRRSS